MKFEKLNKKEKKWVFCETENCSNLASYFYWDLGHFICETCKKKIEENTE